MKIIDGAYDGLTVVSHTRFWTIETGHNVQVVSPQRWWCRQDITQQGMAISRITLGQCFMYGWRNEVVNTWWRGQTQWVTITVTQFESSCRGGERINTWNEHGLILTKQCMVSGNNRHAWTFNAVMERTILDRNIVIRFGRWCLELLWQSCLLRCHQTLGCQGLLGSLCCDALHAHNRALIVSVKQWMAKYLFIVIFRPSLSKAPTVELSCKAQELASAGRNW